MQRQKCKKFALIVCLQWLKLLNTVTVWTSWMLIINISFYTAVYKQFDSFRKAIFTFFFWKCSFKQTFPNIYCAGIWSYMEMEMEMEFLPHRTAMVFSIPLNFHSFFSQVSILVDKDLCCVHSGQCKLMYRYTYTFTLSYEYVCLVLPFQVPWQSIDTGENTIGVHNYHLLMLIF